MTYRVGVDVGGTSIKVGLLDAATGMILRREEVPTPAGGTPPAIASAIRGVVANIDPESMSTVGICLPAIVVHGIARSSANIAQEWVGTDAAALFEAELGRPVAVLNDADAAGLAEISHLTKAERSGVVIMVTLGTGVGSALFTDGRLTPNSELGHLHLDGELVDTHVGFSAVRREGLSIETWAERVAAYLQHLQRLFTPSTFIIGGGGSIYFAQIAAALPSGIRAIAARHGNDGGIIGAAELGTGQGFPVLRS